MLGLRFYGFRIVTGGRGRCFLTMELLVLGLLMEFAVRWFGDSQLRLHPILGFGLPRGLWFGWGLLQERFYSLVGTDLLRAS